MVDILGTREGPEKHLLALAPMGSRHGLGVRSRTSAWAVLATTADLAPYADDLYDSITLCTGSGACS